MNFTQRFEHYTTQRLREIIIELCNDENGGPVRIRDYSQMLFNIHERGISDAMARRSLYEGEDIQDLWRRVCEDYWAKVNQLWYQSFIEIDTVKGKIQVKAELLRGSGLAVNLANDRRHTITHIKTGLNVGWSTAKIEDAKKLAEFMANLARENEYSWTWDFVGKIDKIHKEKKLVGKIREYAREYCNAI